MLMIMTLTGIRSAATPWADALQLNTSSNVPAMSLLKGYVTMIDPMLMGVRLIVHSAHRICRARI
jgi:hypothetical protein